MQNHWFYYNLIPNGKYKQDIWWEIRNWEQGYYRESKTDMILLGIVNPKVREFQTKGYVREARRLLKNDH